MILFYFIIDEITEQSNSQNSSMLDDIDTSLIPLIPSNTNNQTADNFDYLFLLKNFFRKDG